MFSNSREGIREDFDALSAALSRVVEHCYEVLTWPERLALLERLERESRRLRAPQAGPRHPGGGTGQTGRPRHVQPRGRHAGSGRPADDQAIQRDTRSPAQRQHDALIAAGRALLASGALGQHNGLPATIIVTADLRDLQPAGTGRTGGAAGCRSAR